MKALIFNSGIGKRMGTLTENTPKGLLRLLDEKTVFAAQLRILTECGISEVIVTTGKWEDEFAKEAAKFSQIKCIFVNNPLYESTNYIYSMYLAGKYLDDDILMLHGDLVLDGELLKDFLQSPGNNLCLIDEEAKLPQKDFKGRIDGQRLCEVSVNIFSPDCKALYPVYRLNRECIKKWLDKTEEFVKSGKVNVYAEDALNEILDDAEILPVSCNGRYINEIDTPEDYHKVRFEYFLKTHKEYFSYTALGEIIKKTGAKRPFLVMGRHLLDSDTEKYIDSLQKEGCEIYKYCGCKENPDEESLNRALEAFRKHNGDILVSIGGGSVIDTAKWIKYRFEGNKDDLIHICIPTTAGSGSEATRFGVYYKDGIKQSVTGSYLIPEYAICDYTFLYSLKDENRNTCFLDAICHSAESLLSAASDEKSREYAAFSLKILGSTYEKLAAGDRNVYGDVMIASNYAGRAINISKTAAGHALSYALTSGYGIRHGQACMICLIAVLRHCEENVKIKETAGYICSLLGGTQTEPLHERLLKIYRCMNLTLPDKFTTASGECIEELAGKVNIERLNNFIVPLTEDDLIQIYTDVQIIR